MTRIDDPDLARLTEGLRRLKAEPAPDTKAATLAAARAAFASQGSATDTRPNAVRHARRSQRLGARTMFARLISPAALTTAGGALAVTLAVVAILPSVKIDQAPLSMPTPSTAQRTTLPRDTALADTLDTLAPLAGQAPAIRLEAATGMGVIDSVQAPDRAAPPALSRIAPSAKTRARPLMQTAEAPVPTATPEGNTETFAALERSAVQITDQSPVSTFSVDVDTASWSILRSSLTNDRLPPEQAVRIEEMINYFPYAYPAPEGDVPFATQIAVVPSPWNADTRLLRIGLQGKPVPKAARPPVNLVFLIDTSGSMTQANKLPLLKRALHKLLPELQAHDEVAIVTYAGAAGVALRPTSAADRGAIETALSDLRPGGGTAGQAGLDAAYGLARQMRAEGEITRVLLATDGDFNIGASDPDVLEDNIARARASGIYLSVLGFGRGNLDDATMQALAQNGNGIAAYIDNAREARKVLVDQAAGALIPIADDVKIQVEFNPAAIAEYRLIGYETRALRREDFTNDAVDAGDIGAGLQVTALYEITAPNSPGRLTEPLLFQDSTSPDGDGALIGQVRLRWKAPGASESTLQETLIDNRTASMDPETGFAAAIAGFGQILTGGRYLGGWSYDQAIDLALEHRGDDPFGLRTEAVQLMRDAQSLDPDR